MPGTAAQELRLHSQAAYFTASVKPHLVEARRAAKAGAQKRTVNPVLRVIDLLADVDRENIKATLTGGTIEVTLPKGKPRARTRRPAV